MRIRANLWEVFLCQKVLCVPWVLWEVLLCQKVLCFPCVLWEVLLNQKSESSVGDYSFSMRKRLTMPKTRA